jgi:hypothetical protein
MTHAQLHPRPEQYWALAGLSAGVLAFQILLLRVFSFSQWYHFASVAVSLALLGFGAAATLLTLLGERARRRGEVMFCAGMVITALGMIGVQWLNQRVSVRPLFVVWDTGELARLLALNFAGIVPFFGAGLSVGVVFHRWPGAAPRLYAANLLGSGAGCLAAVALLEWLALEAALTFTAAAMLGLAAGYAAWRRGTWPIRHRVAAVCVAAVFPAGAWIAREAIPPLHVCDFKKLSYIRDLPDARVLEADSGLWGRTTLLRSDSLRVAPGLSLRWTSAIAPTDALVIDADRAIAFPRSAAEAITRRDFARATLDAAPFAMRPRDAVAVLGTGEGLAALTMRALGANRVVWVEPNPKIPALFRRRGLEELATPVVENPRRFLETDSGAFDLILFDEARGGGDSLSEDPALTTEAFATALERLRPGGAMAIILPLSNPPRYFPRCLAMLRSALERRGVARPAEHVFALRSLHEIMLGATAQPLTPDETARLETFAEQWNFDLVWMPDLKRERANRHNQFAEAMDYDTARAVLDGRAEEIPRAARLYSLRPASDVRPYFRHTMRWSVLPEAWRTLGREGLMLFDWGALMLAASLCVAALLGVALIVLPLGRLPRDDASPFSRARIVVYFSALGLGYMLLEMAVFQRCVSLLGHPIPAASLVFATFLVGSGLGSFSLAGGDEKSVMRPGRIFAWVAAGAVVAFVGVWGFEALWWRLGFAARAVGLALCMAPLAFALGRPMPWALRRVGVVPGRVPWAWGVNALASVLAAPLATLLAVQAGQYSVWIAGGIGYAAAWGVSRPRQRNERSCAGEAA